MLVYYAHPITDYDTQTEADDIATLEALGFTVFNPNHERVTAGYKIHGFEYFLGLVSRCDAVAFRTFDNGAVGSGVAKEVQFAIDSGKPVFEVGSFNRLPKLTVKQTRAKIKYLQNT